MMAVPQEGSEDSLHHQMKMGDHMNGMGMMHPAMGMGMPYGMGMGMPYGMGVPFGGMGLGMGMVHPGMPLGMTSPYGMPINSFGHMEQGENAGPSERQLLLSKKKLE
jgi:hypothetical protein